MQNNTNPLPEISALVLAALLVIGGIGLLYMSKIDFVAATLMFGSALALFGGNLALKAPSPTQQGQLNAQQEQLTQVVSQMQAMQAQPPVVIHNNIPPTPAPVAPPEPAHTFAFAPGALATTTAVQPAPSQFAPLNRNFTNLELNAVQPAVQQPIPMQPGNTYPYPAVQQPTQ